MTQQQTAPLCWNCCQPLVENVDLPFVLYMGYVRAFCSGSCKEHWLDDSQEGAELKDLFA